MNAAAHFTVIAFDVTCDKRRRRLLNVLESYGERPQESVFEAWLTERERETMLREAHQTLQTDQDKLAIYVLPPIDFADIVSLGLGNVAENITHIVL